ncbi:hypothetical protein KUF71_026368 [Frankliniella fusca]|uniref:Uncharacterized protein n=1 Tax=Frankliniella fusca TaxID=407009 RepID=A0AAE1HCK7_9NEOP|nr:hypothetical protein KUF71_026368 [Frankliniella fusca]
MNRNSVKRQDSEIDVVANNLCVAAGELRLDTPLQAEHSKNKGFFCFWWRNACLGAGFITHRLSFCSYGAEKAILIILKDWYVFIIRFSFICPATLCLLLVNNIPSCWKSEDIILISVKSDVPVVPTVSSEHSNGRRCHGGMGRLLYRPFFHLSYCRCCNSSTLVSGFTFLHRSSGRGESYLTLGTENSFEYCFNCLHNILLHSKN